MRRSPFYAYPDFLHSFYAPPAEAAYHHPSRSFSPSVPASPSLPRPRSVINVPVFDSPSRPSSSHPQKLPISPPPSASPASNSGAVSLIDPSSAATKIQSHFRGFCVRRHRPLLHLRSIAKAGKQLEQLQSDLESPGFHLKIRASDKERLQISESVMAIILRLDAIEGSMAEVRNQRKEATKMAIKLQDAIDAIAMQKDEFADLTPTDGPLSKGSMAPDDGSVVCQRSEEPLCSVVNLAHGERLTVPEEGVMDMNAVQEESSSIEDQAVEECMPKHDRKNEPDMVTKNASPSHPLKVEDQQKDADEPLFDESGCLLVPQAKPLEAVFEAEQAASCVTEVNAGIDATHMPEEEFNNGIDALHHLEAHKDHMENNTLAVKVERDTSVGDMRVASHDSAKITPSDRSSTCMDVVQEVKEDLCQGAELCPITPAAEEKCDYPYGSNDAHVNQLPGSATALEKLTETTHSSERQDSPVLYGGVCEKRSNEVQEDLSDGTNSCDRAKAQVSTLSSVGIPSLSNSTLLRQVSDDCRQLKSLVGKLLAQNKAQSKVLWALSERLELLEHQQHLNGQRNQQKSRERRKLKKGGKRNLKCHNCE